MKQPIRIFQVDAFTSEPFRGNPAGVCLLDKEMPDAWMQNVAFEMNLSETSFIRTGGNGFPVRYFTPQAEVPLCGHATLGSAHILFETGLVSKNDEIVFIAKAGPLPVRYSDGWIKMNFPSYPVEKREIPGDIHIYIGIRPKEFYTTGHGWSFVVLDNENEVRNLNPDFRGLKNSPYGDLIITAPSSDNNFDFCVRCFAPVLGIDEDPVTGSAHCSLVPYWHARTGKRSFISHQVSKREGILKTALLDDRVEISGQARTIFKGELFV